jgi:hypothetical protein
MPSLVDRESLEHLVRLLNTTGKQEASRYAKNLTITSEALVGIILAAQVGGLGPYAYALYDREISADTLNPTNEELTALGRTGVGKATGLALKAIRKVDQQFKERSLLVVHLFYSRSHRHWHMFYFDQRDYTTRRNHWKHGPHIHYSQDTFTREALSYVWAKIQVPKPQFPPALHIRFDYHHSRKR